MGGAYFADLVERVFASIVVFVEPETDGVRLRIGFSGTRKEIRLSFWKPNRENTGNVVI